MCLYPRLIKNKKYIATKKNGGVIPAVIDNRTKAVPVGCGSCIECRKQKKREWQIRLFEEIKHDKNGIMVTLTFSNEALKELQNIEDKGYERDNNIAKKAVRRFLERWRKKHKKSVKHWLTTEIGGKGQEHIHLHGIIWTEHIEDIDTIWKYGFTKIGDGKGKGYVNEKTINYISKYVTKKDLIHKEYKPIILTSAGIGKGYINNERNINENKFREDKTKDYYVTKQGFKLALPKYYRNHIYNDEEREMLWIDKLDQNIRYVDGEKINMNDKNSTEKYYKRLHQARIKNKNLGFGNNEKDWTREKYEQERRDLLNEKHVLKK